MDFNFNNLDFKRVIMHTIIPKEKGAAAEAEYQDELFVLNDDVIDTLKTRLIDAVGIKGRAFQLQIKDTYRGSFYDLCSGMKLSSDEEFIQKSKAIADQLAASQSNSNLPGGFLLVVQAVDPDTEKDWYITIKAEPHQALTTRIVERKAVLEVLDKIFLSPTQKLFKIGMLEEVNLEYPNPNQKYNCYIFDYQFSTSSTPAAYFYDKFLGFSIDSNMQIQTNRYFTLTEDFIEKNPKLESDEKQDAMDALRMQMQDQSQTINPEEFSKLYFGSDEVRAQYADKIASKLPGSIFKDTSLINNRLSTKKLSFPDKIKVSGPDDSFDKRVRIVKNQEALDALRVSPEDFTILVIDGRPFKK